MSIEVTARAAAFAGFSTNWSLRALAAAFKARSLPDSMSGLSDHYLRDLGLERPLAADAWERAMAKDRLLEAGWRYSQRV